MEDTKNILAIGASSSRNSINRRLAKYASAQMENAEVNLLDINDFEMPIFSVDRESESSVHELALKFGNHVSESDAIIISFAEHNGSYSAAFKNVLDWSSRLKEKIWNEKSMFLLATSPGGRGGATVLDLASNYFPFMGAEVVAKFSLPSFYDNFSDEEGINDAELQAKFENELEKFKTSLKQVKEEG